MFMSKPKQGSNSVNKRIIILCNEGNKMQLLVRGWKVYTWNELVTFSSHFTQKVEQKM